MLGMALVPKSGLLSDTGESATGPDYRLAFSQQSHSFTSHHPSPLSRYGITPEGNSHCHSTFKVAVSHFTQKTASARALLSLFFMKGSLSSLA